jgi:hypothetical protein
MAAANVPGLTLVAGVGTAALAVLVGALRPTFPPVTGVFFFFVERVRALPVFCVCFGLLA